MRSVLALAVALALAGSCTDEGAAAETLRVSGYKDIAFHGYSFGGCSKDDGTCTEFMATAPNGSRVKGAVGCGFFCKGCTVRLMGTP